MKRNRNTNKQMDRLAPHVAETLNALAHLIDETIELRGGEVDAHAFAARFLGVGPDKLVIEAAELGMVDFITTGARFTSTTKRRHVATVFGESQTDPPELATLKIGDTELRYPLSLHAAFDAGRIAPVALVVGFVRTWQSNDVMIYATAEHADHARAYLTSLTERNSSTNPFRNQVLAVGSDSSRGITFEAASFRPATRDDVILPDGVWDTLDRHVVGLFANQEKLAAAGLATNRGVLLHGPPGTGKTAAARALATELRGSATVLFCPPQVARGAMGAVYEEMAELAPALVVIEDLDTIFGHAESASMLAALDGARTQHAGVVTLATVNDVAKLSKATVRVGRFDVRIEVGLPDRRQRAQIVARYVQTLDGDVDAAAVATATDGATGAELRELISEAVMASGDGAVTTELLVRLARGRFVNMRVGQYV